MYETLSYAFEKTALFNVTPLADVFYCRRKKKSTGHVAAPAKLSPTNWSVKMTRRLTEIAPSVAGRRVRARKRSSEIGELIDPFRRRSIQIESALERFWLMVFIEDPSIMEIREQQRVFYRDGERWRHRWIDVVLIYRSGKRRFVEFKYSSEATRPFRDKFVENSAYFLEPGDEIEVLTEAELRDYPLQRIFSDIRYATKKMGVIWSPRGV